MLFSFTWRKLFPAGHEWRFLWCVDTLFDPRATLRMPSMPKPIKSTKLTQGKWGFMQQGQQLRLLAAEKNKLNTMTVGKFVHAQCIERVCEAFDDEDTYIKAVHVTVGQHHGRVVFVHLFARHATDEARVWAVSEGKVARQLVQVLAAHWTLRTALVRTRFVTVAERKVSKGTIEDQWPLLLSLFFSLNK